MASATALAILLSACGEERDANEVSMVTPLDVVDGNADPGVGQADPAIAATLADAGVANSLPARFQGVFDQDAAGCRASSSVFRLRIEPRTLRFHESVGEVRAVTSDGADAVRVASAYSGEGMEWSSSQRLALDDDDTKLTITGEGTPFTRVRC